MDQPFCMHPTQRMPADGELASVVTDDHHIAQQSVRLDAAPQRAFGGYADRVGRDLQGADAKAVEMHPPGSLIGELRLPMCRQLVDDRPGQGALTHVVQRRLIDDVVWVPGAQQIEKVQSALTRPRAEPGEVVVADLSTATRGVILPRRRRLPRLPGGLGSPAGSMLLGLIRGRPFRPLSRAFS